MKYKVVVSGNPVRTNVGSLGASSVILIEKDGTTILVDTTHYGRRHLLLEGLAEAGLEPSDIDYVILTHLHWDHSLNYDLFENSQFLISKQEMDYNIEPSPKDRFTLRNFHKLAHKLNIKEITNNNTSVIEGVQLTLTPGHTNGHVIVTAKDKETSIIMTGDAIPNLRAWYRERPDILTGSIEEAERSTKIIKELAKDAIVVPGHDTPFSFVGKTVNYLFTTDVEFTFREDRERDFVVRAGESASKQSYR